MYPTKIQKCPLKNRGFKERKGADIETKLLGKDKQIETLMKKLERFEQMIQSFIDSGQLQPSNRK